jgi:hypothetical protein
MGLLETLLAMALLAVVLGLTFWIFFAGTRSFYAVDRQHDLHREASLVLDRITRNLAAAPASSISLEPALLAMASCRDENGQTVLDGSAQPVWQAYMVFFVAERELRQRRVVRTATTSSVSVLEQYDAGSGAQPLSTYASGGDVLARHVRALACARPRADVVNLRLELDKPAEGQQRARHLEVETTVSLRVQ